MAGHDNDEDVLGVLLTNPAATPDEARWLALGHVLKEIRNTGRETREQVKTTNGRVTRLELWRATMAGALAVITLGMPVLLWLINRAAS